MFNSIDWTAVNAVAMVVYTIIFAVSVWVLRNQLRASRDVAFGQAFVAAVQLHESQDAVRARETVRRAKGQPAGSRFHGNVEDSAGKVIASREDDARIVCRTYNTIASMVCKGIIPGELVQDMWGREMVAQWDILKEFVATERDRVGDDSLWFKFDALRATFKAMETRL